MSMAASRRSVVAASGLAALLLLGAATPATAGPAAAGDVAVPTAVSGARIVVTYRNAAAAARGGAGVANIRLESSVDAIHMKVFRATVGTERRAMEALARQPGVETIESEVTVRSTATPNDPLWKGTVSWAHDRVNLRTAWGRTKGSPRITIAILDSGLEWHSEMHGRIAGGWDFVENDNRANDPRGHGTMSAGAAAARGNNRSGLAGGCWECRIMPVRVLDQNGTGYAANVVRGIIWATDKGAKVISMSFGGFAPSTAMASAVAYARKRGVVVLGSAGNDGENLPFYPASLPGVIGVAASDPRNAPYRWSNRGNAFELTAPGCFWTTTSRRGYANFCGTSASTPLVAGIVGLMRSARPDLPGYMIERALLATARRTTFVSHGLPNADAAITYARRMKAPAPPAPPRAKNTTHAWVEAGGSVAIEAERANQRIGRATIDWIDATVKPGFVGRGYVAAWGDKGLSHGRGYATTAAELKYRVQFTTPGVYSVWFRTWAPNAGGNSVNVGVNGKPLSATDKIVTGLYGRWGWTRNTEDGNVAKIAISKPGLHTINVWVREDGFRFDRIVLLRGGKPVGPGPAESATVPIP
jgi:hypothetical protein